MATCTVIIGLSNLKPFGVSLDRGSGGGAPWFHDKKQIYFLSFAFLSNTKRCKGGRVQQLQTLI